MRLYVQNRQGKVAVSRQVKEVIRRVVREAEREEGAARRGEVGVVLVDDAEIRELNRKYLGIDEPTDVLAFDLDDEDIQGDIIISMETAARQAKLCGHSLDREIGLLVVHGLLHLRGYDHEDERGREAMEDMASRIISRVFG